MRDLCRSYKSSGSLSSWRRTDTLDLPVPHVGDDDHHDNNEGEDDQDEDDGDRNTSYDSTRQRVISRGYCGNPCDDETER